jgi:CheY-like chemotaxis protein
MVIAREKVNLTSLFISTCQSLSHVIQNDNVKFIIDNPYDNCTATVDYNRIAQIITNFVTNAAKHTKKGYIKVGYKYIDGGLRFYVQDTGAGIPKDKQNEIFERFVKLNNFVQGTGLGLSICKAIVNRCGGNIGCDSEVGKGSIFWFWTPCKVELIKERQKTTETQTIADVPETTVKENTGKNILVAEDDDSNFILVKYLLKEYFVDRAKNGKEAIEKAQRHKYDAILMDMRMPIIGGMEAANEIRTFDKSVPIIAVTANAFDSDRAKAIEAGCDDYISKPLDEATLKELLLKYIKK